MSAQLAQLEEEKKQYQEQLEILLTSLNDDPENAELLALKAELDEMIKVINDGIAEIQPKREASASRPPPTTKNPTPSAQPPEKWSRENHPAFKKAAQEEKERQEREAAAAEPATTTPISYAVNDTVLAKWVTGDKGFYPARITAVTGSSTQPIYSVKFKSYDTVETLRAKDIRPISNKRKADGGSAAISSTTSGLSGGVDTPTSPGGTPLSPGASTTTNNGIVLTSAPSVYPQAEQQAAADGEKPAKKFKKIKANKELEKGKNKWQEFNSRSKFGKTNKKESMFRTPDGIHGRVGFTGSGQAMRKDPTRSRHIYQPNEDVD